MEKAPNPRGGGGSGRRWRTGLVHDSGPLSPRVQTGVRGRAGAGGELGRVPCPPPFMPDSRELCDGPRWGRLPVAMLCQVFMASLTHQGREQESSPKGTGWPRAGRCLGKEASCKADSWCPAQGTEPSSAGREGTKPEHYQGRRPPACLDLQAQLAVSAGDCSSLQQGRRYLGARRTCLSFTLRDKSISLTVPLIHRTQEGSGWDISGEASWRLGEKQGQRGDRGGEPLRTAQQPGEAEGQERLPDGHPTGGLWSRPSARLRDVASRGWHSSSLTVFGPLAEVTGGK